MQAELGVLLARGVPENVPCVIPKCVPSCKGVARGGTAWHGLLGSWSKPLPVTAAGGRDQAGGDQGHWVLPFLLFPWLQGPHSGNSRFDVPTPAASPSLDPGEAVEELPPPGAQGSFAVSSENPCLGFLSQVLAGSSGKS